MSGKSKKSPSEVTTDGRWIVRPHKSLPAPNEDFLLPICIRGGDYHHGEKLAALINALQGRCKTIIVLISGVLYRHSLQITDNLCPEEAQRVAYEEGNKWLERNKHILESSLTPVEIVNWQDLLIGDIYNQQRGLLEDAIANLSYSEGKGLFDDDIQKFLERYSSRQETNTGADAEKVFDPKHERLSRIFIKEECAMFLAVCKKFPDITKFIYPGQKSKAIAWTFKYFECGVEVVQPELVNFKGTNLKLYARKSLKMEEVLAALTRIDSQAEQWEKYGAVQADCRIFFLKGATPYTRGFLEDRIIRDIRRQRPEFELWREGCSKSTILFFVTPNKYNKREFFGAQPSWQDYIPKYCKIRYEAPVRNPIPTITARNCVVNLVPFEKGMLEEILLFSFNNTQISLELLVMHMQFVYSVLAVENALPEILFYVHYTNEQGKIYASFVDKEKLDQQMQKLFEFLATLRESSAYLESETGNLDLPVRNEEIEFKSPHIWQSLFCESIRPKGTSVRSSDGGYMSEVDTPLLEALRARDDEMSALTLPSSSTSTSSTSSVVRTLRRHVNAKAFEAKKSSDSSPAYSSYTSSSYGDGGRSEEISPETTPASSPTNQMFPKVPHNRHTMEQSQFDSQLLFSSLPPLPPKAEREKQQEDEVDASVHDLIKAPAPNNTGFM